MSLLPPERVHRQLAKVGLLTYSRCDAFPLKEQWLKRLHNVFEELTATGLAPDSHRVPF